MPRQKAEKELGPADYELISVDPNDVAFNEANPRGEAAEAIYSDPEFTQLVESVHKFGVLVPIVVCRQQGHKSFRLIDGERRLRAALKTKTAFVPAHVTKMEHSMNDRVQAFHTHMLRKQWGRTAQTRALKCIIKELRPNEPKPSEQELFSELQTLTGYTKSQLGALLSAAKYADSVLDDVDQKKLAWSHLVQFEESFVEPVRQHYPDLFKEFGVHRLRSILLRKAKRKVLAGTRALMEHIVPVVARAQTLEEKTYAKELLREFVKSDDFPAEEVLKQFNRKFPESATDLLNILDRTIETADSLKHLVQSLPGAQAMLSHQTKVRELYEALDKLRHVMVEKRRLHRSILE